MHAVLRTELNANLTVLQNVPGVPTDAQGHFTIDGVPVGLVKLMADGSTAKLPGQYPSLEYDLITVAGQNNTVGQPLYLLPLNTANQMCVTSTTGGGTLTLPEAPGFSLTFGPGQVTFPGGSKAGCVSVTVVNRDKVPMSPGFGQQPRFIVTIQPAGAVFNPPAAITLPNVDALAPRAVTEMYSYDHDIESFVAIGTGMVSEDGQVIRSGAGVGVLKAGWHCGGNPQSTGTAATCRECYGCVANECIPISGTRCRTGVDICNRGVCLKGTCEQETDPELSGKCLPDPNYKNVSNGCSVPSSVVRLLQSKAPYPDVSTCGDPNNPACGLYTHFSNLVDLACDIHDVCYGECHSTTYGGPDFSWKASCDATFLTKMMKVCQDALLRGEDQRVFENCTFLAGAYAAGLDNIVSEDFYRRAQSATCKCCP